MSLSRAHIWREVSSSEMEQIAQNAERDSIKYKMVEFMGDKLGEEFDAHISGITSYGIYFPITFFQKQNAKV